MPADGEIEQALLAILLANYGVDDQNADILRPEHFADELHGRIYEACSKLIERGETHRV